MAWYKTGTVAVTNASTTVTGTGTNFVSGAQVGDGFLGPNELLYEITAINSATSLTIAPAYGGATASSQNYAIAPTQGLVASLASDVTDLITDYQSVVDNAGAGKFGDGSAASPAIRFTNDQDTGFFRDTANEIAFATAGVKRGEFTSSGIQMLDGQKFIAGTGNDLSIFHNGSTSLIEDNGTGGITLRSDLFTVQNAAGTETVAQFVQDGFVKLFHNNSQVFTTTSTGATITGSLGIGTSSVDSLLHLQKSDATAYSATATDGQVGVGPTIYLENPANSNTTVGGQIVFGMRSTEEQARIGATGGTAPALTFGTGDAEAMRIDSSGHLQLSGSTDNVIRSGLDSSRVRIFGGGTESVGNGAALTLQGVNHLGGNYADLASGTGGYINFRIGTSNAMRLDASGNLFVGKTSNDFGATAGISLNGDNDRIYATKSGGNPITVNRLTSDGDLIQFRHTSTSVGAIATLSSQLYIGSSATSDAYLRFGNSVVRPCASDGANRDNAIDLGASGARFDDIYATNGTIQTSDRNEKQDIAELSDAEQRVAVAAKGLMRKFRWRGAVEAKGDDARTHFGIIAQDLQAAFAAEGLDAGDYAMFISSTWWETQTEVPAVEAVAEVLDDDGNVVTEAVEAADAYTRTDTYDTQEEAPEGATERTRLGVRYSELLAFIIAAI